VITLLITGTLVLEGDHTIMADFALLIREGIKIKYTNSQTWGKSQANSDEFNNLLVKDTLQPPDS